MPYGIPSFHPALFTQPASRGTVRGRSFLGQDCFQEGNDLIKQQKVVIERGCVLESQICI